MYETLVQTFVSKINPVLYLQSNVQNLENYLQY